MRNIAPSSVERVLEASFPDGAVVVVGWFDGCDISAPRNLSSISGDRYVRRDGAALSPRRRRP
jgi:hypothetical protein